MAAKGRTHAVRTGPIERKPRKSGNEITYSAKDVPDGMSIEQTMDWVSGDARKAEAVLAVEKKADQPRTSLLSSMQRLVDGRTGAGVATGEA